MKLGLLIAACLAAASPTVAQQADDPPAEAAAEPARAERLSDLPLLELMERPSPQTLLGEPPVDWIVVSGDHVIIVEPVSPRPGFLEAIDRRINEHADRRERLPRDEYERTREKLNDIRVRLAEDITGFAYDFERDLAERIIYHEDHCLAAAATLRESESLLTAWELLEHVRSRDRNWPGLEAETNRMILADAAVLTKRGEAERALTVLETLRTRDPKFEDLPLRYADAARSLAAAGVEAGNYRQARHFRRRLQAAYPDSRTVELIGRRLQDLAGEQLAAAERAEDPAERSDRVRLAARIWPDERRLPRFYQEIVEPHVVLHVGTTQLAGAADSPLLSTPGTLRHRALTTAAVFQPVAVEGDLVRYGSSLVDRWRLTDLGRRAVVDLRPGDVAVDAFGLASAIRQAENDPATFGDRWQGLFAGVRPASPGRLELTMAASPLRLDALLGELPVGLAGAFRRAGETTTPFRPLGATAAVRYVRVTPHRGGTPAEIIEHRFPSAEEFGRSLRRDELDLAVDVPPHLVGRLREEQWFSEEVVLGVCGMPVTHLIQFRPGSPASGEVMLRLGLARAVSRQAVLTDVFLNAADDPWGPLPGKEYVRLTDSPFRTGSYANDPNVPRREQDVQAAVALGLLAKRRMGDDWGSLRMIAADVPEIRAAAAALVSQWRAAGFPVELVAAEESLAAIESDAWDLVYRTVSLAEPTIDLWPLLALSDTADLAGIAGLPEPLRRRLITVDRIDDWPSAAASLQAVHRTLWEQAILIPLWEIDRLAIRRRSIREAPVSPLDPYDGITTWQAEPSIPQRDD